jgi:hypothetical protein
MLATLFADFCFSFLQILSTTLLVHTVQDWGLVCPLSAKQEPLQEIVSFILHYIIIYYYLNIYPHRLKSSVADAAYFCPGFQIVRFPSV